MRIGQKPILLRVELWNKSADIFVAGIALYPLMNQTAHLRLEGWNEKGERVFLLESVGGTGVSIYDKWWNLIAPGHYYGTEYELDSNDIEFVRTPGRYRLIATYVSRGGVTAANPEYQIPAYNVWKGELASNAVWIQVFPGVGNPKHK
jgi:hypothetical protein